MNEIILHPMDVEITRHIQWYEITIKTVIEQDIAFIVEWKKKAEDPDPAKARSQDIFISCRDCRAMLVHALLITVESTEEKSGITSVIAKLGTHDYRETKVKALVLEEKLELIKFAKIEDLEEIEKQREAIDKIEHEISIRQYDIEVKAKIDRENEMRKTMEIVNGDIRRRGKASRF